MQFIYPYFLFALFSVIVPIILHFLRFRKYKKMDFSHVRFLQHLDVEQKKRSRLRDWLVLIARILILICLVLAFAQPYIPEEKNRLLQEGGERYVSIYLDNSFSMEAGDREGSLLEQSKAAIKGMIKTYNEGDKFQLLTNDFSVLSQRFVPKEEFLQALDEVGYTPLTRTWSEIRYRQKDAFSSFFIPNEEQVHYLFSDFQRNLEIENFDPADSLTSICLMPFTAPSVQNIGIDSLYWDAPVVEKNRESLLSVVLRNYGLQAQENIAVKLNLGDKTYAILNMDIPAQTNKKVEIPLQIIQDGWHFGSVEIDDYPIVFDNKVFFSFYVKPQNKIWEIYQQKPNAFISKLFSEDAAFSYQSKEISSISYADIKLNDLIILSGLHQIPSALSSELNTYVSEGGNVCLIPPPYLEEGTNKENWQNFVWELCRIKLETYDTTTLNVQKIEFTHPLFFTAIEKKSTQIQLPFSKGHYPATWQSSVAARALMRLQNEDPFLIEYKHAKGRIYILTNSQEEGFGNFSQQALFVVSFINMALMKGESALSFRQTGKDIQFYFPAQNGKESVWECRPFSKGSSFIPTQHSSFGEKVIQWDPLMQEQGHYVFLSEGDTMAALSFNYDRQESKTETYSVLELEKKQKEAGWKQSRILQSQNWQKASSLWKIFIIFALLFILVEIILTRFWKSYK